MLQPHIIPRKCPARPDICPAIPACPQGAISYVQDERERMGGKIVFDYDKCDGCGLCVSECCGSAIELK